MKYAGSITILDDESTVVFERELSADEIIGLILGDSFERLSKAANDAQIPLGDRRFKATKRLGLPTEARKKPAGRPRKELSEAQRSAGWGGSPRAPKPCCGSLGARHKKECFNAAGSTNDIVAPKKPHFNFERYEPEAAQKPHKVDNGRILTEEEFDTVKEMRADDKNTMQIRGELGDDCSFQHINWAILSHSYDAYVKHAKANA